MKYLYKIYNLRNEYLGNLNCDKISSALSFSSKVGGQGEITISYISKFDDFPAELIAGGNLVRVYSISENDPLGILLYTGFISKIAPYFSENGEGVRITCLGLISLFTRYLYEHEYTNEDVAWIFQDLINNFNDVYGVDLLSYDEESMPNTGNIINFEASGKIDQSLKKAFDFCPENYSWRIDPDGKVYLNSKENQPVHRFTIGKHIFNFNAELNYEKIVNCLHLSGDDNLSGIYENLESQNQYGIFEKTESNDDLTTQNNLDIYGNSYVENYKDPLNTATFEIPSAVYDINKIKVGHSVKINNFNKNSQIFDDDMLIAAVDYTPEKVKISLEEFNTFAELIR